MFQNRLITSQASSKLLPKKIKQTTAHKQQRNKTPTAIIEKLTQKCDRIHPVSQKSTRKLSETFLKKKIDKEMNLKRGHYLDWHRTKDKGL